MDTSRVRAALVTANSWSRLGCTGLLRPSKVSRNPMVGRGPWSRSVETGRLRRGDGASAAELLGDPGELLDPLLGARVRGEQRLGVLPVERRGEVERVERRGLA